MRECGQVRQQPGRRPPRESQSRAGAPRPLAGLSRARQTLRPSAASGPRRRSHQELHDPRRSLAPALCGVGMLRLSPRTRRPPAQQGRSPLPRAEIESRSPGRAREAGSQGSGAETVGLALGAIATAVHHSLRLRVSVFRGMFFPDRLTLAAAWAAGLAPSASLSSCRQAAPKHPGCDWPPSRSAPDLQSIRKTG